MADEKIAGQQTEETTQAETQKTAEQLEVEALQKELKEQEQALVDIREQCNSTIRRLKKAKLKLVIPSDAVIKLARAAGPMDDVFFTKLGEEAGAIEEVVRTVSGIPVRVKRAIPQYTITNIGSRGVRLDNYSEIVVEAELLEDCEWGKKGALVDIEVQKDDNTNHEYRVYYNGASMVINNTPADTDFGDLPKVIVIYISAFDVFDEGEVMYETIKADLKSLKRRKSPVTEYYVNTANLDKAIQSDDERTRKVGALMKVFKDPDWYDDQFPAFSKRKRELHETEEGVEDMSKEIQLLIDEQVKLNNEENDRQKEEFIKNLMDNLGLTREQIVTAMTKPKNQEDPNAVLV